MTGSVLIPYAFGALTSAPTTDLDSNFNALATYANDPTNRVNIGSDSGTANAYVITTTPAITASTATQTITFIPANTNTGASTAASGSITAQTIYKNVSGSLTALTAGDIVAAVPAVIVLTSAGNWLLLNPAAKSATGGAFDKVNVQVFTSSGTYTPTTGMVYCMVEAMGGGGGGGGQASYACGGGGGGNYTRSFFTAATVGSSQAITVGAGGAGGSSGAGTSGGLSSFGSLQTAGGGLGCPAPSGITNIGFCSGGGGGSGGSGTISIPGGGGGSGIDVDISANLAGISGAGGSSVLGGGGHGIGATNATNGVAGATYGGGGSGAVFAGTGGSGAQGIIIITEFLSV